MIKSYLLAAALLGSALAHGQTLYDTLRNPNDSGLSAYIFVSAHLSDTTLIALARDARNAGVSLVLNGFVNDTPNRLAALIGTGLISALVFR